MDNGLAYIRTALISVTDKTGISELIKGLYKINPDLKVIASGGTAKALNNEQISFIHLKDYTRFPECFEGRVKTMHPLIAGGILFRRGKDDQEANQLGIQPIDLVICNLYDFEDASRKKNIEMDQLIEHMDIGGSTLIRSACKNYKYVVALVDPKDYEPFLNEVKENKGSVSLQTRQQLAIKAMNLSADYEALLAKEFTERLSNGQSHRPMLMNGRKLRYGENPDQEAWVYHFKNQEGIAQASILSGKELSYNNFDDATVAYHAAQELLNQGCKHGTAIIKHGSLCAYSTGITLLKSFQKAWESDSTSAFGSVIAFTSHVFEEMIEEMKTKFIEVIIAPSFDNAFVEWAKASKPNLRLLQLSANSNASFLYKNISGGMLVQTQKNKLFPEPLNTLFKPSNENQNKKIGVVTKKQPSNNQQGIFAFSIAAVNFTKSNAIAIAREYEPGQFQILSLGAGQPNRVDSLQRLALPKAIENLQKENAGQADYDLKKDLAKCVLASDGFFPFDDSIRKANAMGIKYCIQPGGSMRDQDVIDAADELDMCMIFTGERYFYH